jgi:glycine/D-amino acid oxidase-like deaminating enzyme
LGIERFATEDGDDCSYRRKKSLYLASRPGYFALGYGGNGITFSYIAAGLLLDLFLQRQNPDLEIFRFNR